MHVKNTRIGAKGEGFATCNNSKLRWGCGEAFNGRFVIATVSSCALSVQSFLSRLAHTWPSHFQFQIRPGRQRCPICHGVRRQRHPQAVWSADGNSDGHFCRPLWHAEMSRLSRRQSKYVPCFYPFLVHFSFNSLDHVDLSRYDARSMSRLIDWSFGRTIHW